MTSQPLVTVDSASYSSIVVRQPTLLPAGPSPGGHRRDYIYLNSASGIERSRDILAYTVLYHPDSDLCGRLPQIGMTLA